MSNFTTLCLIDGTSVGTAPNRFQASTPDSLSTITAAGYLNDINKKIKMNDVFEVNYLDTSTFPLYTGESSIYGTFRVQYDPILLNYNLLPTSNVQVGIASFGIDSDIAPYPAGATTATLNDSTITPNSIVIARIKSSVNPAIIKTVSPGSGTLTIVVNSDPGTAVVEYISFAPSVLLQNQGVYGSKYSYAGGSATIIIPSANVVPGMEVNANFVSQTNSSLIKTVLAGVGTITVVTTADPGASVIAYSAITPSAALTTLGLYAAKYTNAGGSATTTITDANITASSIVTADWQSQTNSVEINKVTASAGTLTILSSGDPGASVLSYSAVQPEGAQSGSFLVASSNLSDVSSPSVSLANLGGVALIGSTMTGKLTLERGTAISTAGAATVNFQSGVITTEALTTAAASAYAFTLTDSRILSTSIVLLQLMGGTNTTRGLELRAVPGAGSATISIFNNNVAASALNGTLIFGFLVI